MAGLDRYTHRNCWQNLKDEKEKEKSALKDPRVYEMERQALAVTLSATQLFPFDGSETNISSVLVYGFKKKKKKSLGILIGQRNRLDVLHFMTLSGKYTQAQKLSFF